MKSIHDRKRALRRDIRVRRSAFVTGLPEAARARAFSVAPTPLRALMDAAAVIGAYAPVGDEADPLHIAEGRVVALPWFADRKAPMAFKLWRTGSPLHPDPFGGLQPGDDAPAAEPALLLMPLLGFDRCLQRLGQGAAYYDRYCAAHPDALRVGIAWSVQELETVPVEGHDEPLDAVLTEAEWIERGTPRI